MTLNQIDARCFAAHFLFAASTMVSLVLSQSAHCSALPWIYFADNNAQTVNRIAFDGSDFQVLANTERALLGLTIDRVSRKLYWSDNPLFGTARLHRANLDGTNADVFYEATIPNQGETVGQLAIDENLRRMYWIDSGADRIRRINLDGTGLTDILVNEPRMESALELDSSGSQLYFSTGSFLSDPKIERINVDGTGRQSIANTYAYSIYLDETQDRILGADWNSNRIFELPSPLFQRHNLFSAAAPRDVQRFADFLIYSDLASQSQSGEQGVWSRIVRSGLDGSNPVILREVNRWFQPADPIAFYIFVPEPSALLQLLAAAISLAFCRAFRR